MSRDVTKPTNWPVRLAKTQISLGIRPVWSESSLCAQWVATGPSFHHAPSEDSDQTGRMPRLILVFAGRTSHFVGSNGSNVIQQWTVQHWILKYVEFPNLMCSERKFKNVISICCYILQVKKKEISLPNMSITWNSTVLKLLLAIQFHTPTSKQLKKSENG